MTSHIKKALATVSFIYIIFFLFSFKNEKGSVAPSESVKIDYLISYNHFLTSIDSLSNVVDAFYISKADQNDVITIFSACRTEFKNIEFLLAYLDPQGVKNHINGAPLPSLEPKVPEINVIDPSGLQRIDEIIFSPSEEWDQKELKTLISDLKTNAKTLYRVHQAYRFYDRNVFEASRSGLIRIFTLGVTGFDTPASSEAIAEAQTGIKSIAESMGPYLKQVNAKNPKLATEITHHFEAAIDMLEKNTDFDSFDRLQFLKEHINPLYGLLLDAQLTLGIETIYETTSRELPVNYLSQNLFDEAFLNPYFYSKLNKETDKESLRKLGQILFFDPILSHNNKRACASCHDPAKGFADGRPKSLAFDMEGTVDRNAPTVINAVYATKLFHDMRSDQFDSQIEHVILNEKEFHTDYAEIIGKLEQSEEYVSLFKSAFPGYKKPIFKSSIAQALASYLISLNSFNSPFDKYVRGESTQLPEEAKRGFNLFMGKAVCGTCHFAPVFNGNVPPLYRDSESEVLGVTTNEDFEHPILDGDEGRYANQIIHDHAPFMKHAFKTPTVRNIALTAPYMHNGAYQSLETVVDFYNKGGGAGMGIELPNQTLPFDSLALNQQEVNDLIAFMKSLTDTSGLSSTPVRLPLFESQTQWNTRQIGGEY